MDDNYKKDENLEEKKPDYTFWAEQINKSTPDEEEESPLYYTYSNDEESSPWSEEVIEPKPEKKGKKVGKFILKALFFGIIAAIAFVAVNYGFNMLNPNTGEDNYILSVVGDGDKEDKEHLKIKTTEAGTVDIVHSSKISNVIEKTMPSIVSIRSITNQQSFWFGVEIPSGGSGSGIIIAKNDDELLIATNNHVVAGADEIIVTFSDGSESSALIKGTDATADLAVIKADLADINKDTLEEIKIVEMGNSDEVKVGEMVIAIGNALGYGQSATVGYVSAKDREVQVSDNYTYRTMVLLQTDAAINPGNSGGALLNLEGELIGINTVKYADYKVEGMGFAIPISRAKPIINELKNREILTVEEQGFLGVFPTDVTEKISEALNMPIGVFLTTVEEASAADEGGLKEGDIIIKINAIEITSSDQLREMISSIRAGTEIDIDFMRNEGGTYKERSTKVTLSARP